MGHFVSPETREKIRKANTDKHPTQETRAKMAIASRRTLNGFEKGHKVWLGREHSEESKKKMSELAKGKPHPNQSGDKHPMWKGGITPENLRIRTSIQFRLWRESVFARDNWTCQKYGIEGYRLHSHHIQNFADYPELRFAIDNGITLSEKAHKEFHQLYGKRNNTKEQLEEFLS